MKRSSNRILTSHVGSLIRPPALQEFLRVKQAGNPYDTRSYEKCLTESVAAIVREQAQAGIDVVSDGEFGKSISWSQYALERLSGFERRPIKHNGQPELQRDIDNFKAALKGVQVEEAFLPVAAPASVIPDRKNEFYKSEDDIMAAIAAAMHTEYKMIIDAGFLVQLDDARNAVTYDRMVCLLYTSDAADE